MSDFVRLETVNRVARITLDRPPLNVLTTAMMRDLTAALDQAATLASVRVVRVDAVGKMFSAGVDVADHEADLLPPMLDALGKLFEAFERLPLPSVTVVHAHALGGGCEIALATDLCLASDRATFGQPEIRLGVSAPPASVLLPRMIGERRALGLLLGGETISATQARDLGIVNQVFPAATFASDADAWINRLAESSGAALRLAKRTVTGTRGLPVADAHRAALRIYRDELMKTEDAGEGLRAFLEKRPPHWKDR